MSATRIPRQTREAQVLAAAAALFDQQGARATTTGQVAGAAGVSKALLFSLFATREQLVSCVLAARLDELGRSLRGLQELPPGEALVEWHERCFDYGLTHPALAEMALSLLAEPWTELRQRSGALVHLHLGRSLLPVLAPLIDALDRLDATQQGRLRARHGEELTALAETLYASTLGVLALIWHGRGTRGDHGSPVGVPLDPAGVVQQHLTVVRAALLTAEAAR